MDTVKDFLGQTITVGDYVVYPSRTGSSLYVTYGRVVAVVDGKLRVRRLRRGSLSGYYSDVSKRKVFIDIRTGKQILPYLHGDRHIQELGHFEGSNWVPTVFNFYVQEVEVPTPPVIVGALDRVVKVPPVELES